MEFKSHDSQFLHRLQDLYFVPPDSDSAAEKADTVRNMMVHLSYGQTSNIVPMDCDALESYKHQYEILMDSFDAKTDNDSQKWQSSLTLKKVLQMDYVKEIITWEEKNAKQNLPSGDEEELVFEKIETSDVRKSSQDCDFQDSREIQGSANRNLPAAQNLFYRKAPKRQIENVQSEADHNQDHSKLSVSAFKTAKEQLTLQQNKKFQRAHSTSYSHGYVKKSLGTRCGPSSKFVLPISTTADEQNTSRSGSCSKPVSNEEPTDDRLKGIDPKMIDLINNEIMDHGPKISWNDIAGLDFAKKTIKEIVVWPMLRPDIFTGLRGPPKGLLLFGPPGTGKTLIGKCIASQSKSTFFCISASTLTSKWVGEGEKMVRALFAVARCNQPAVLFIDEIDSLLSQRTDGEHEASRRIKTEFLIQLDGAGTDGEERILVVGATNRPQEIDEAARRRFIKRLYIPLPECAARRQIIVNLMENQKSSLTDKDLDKISQKTEGYSGSDMANLCREAALGPIRSIPFDDIETISTDQVRCIIFQDFEEAFSQVRASVSPKDLNLYTEWNNLYGSFGK